MVDRSQAQQDIVAPPKRHAITLIKAQGKHTSAQGQPSFGRASF